jgi:LysM repeat protein
MKTATMRVHEIVAGDTLSKLAAQYYGDAARYHEIAKANAIVWPFTVFIGQKILIPFPADQDELNPITVTAQRMQSPVYPEMPVPMFDEIEVTASRFNPWLVAGLVLGALYVADKKGR